MSSPVHTALCVRRDGKIVDIEIGPTTATDVHFPVSPTFGLALLHESAAWSRRTRAPLASVITFEEMIELSSISEPNETKEALVATFVVSARYVATRNWTPALWRRGADGSFIDPGIARTDPRAIAASRALDDAYDTRATLRIEVTEERWCAHLEASMTWDVYAFDYAASLLV